jgi:hypothetical protein
VKRKQRLAAMILALSRDELVAMGKELKSHGWDAKSIHHAMTEVANDKSIWQARKKVGLPILGVTSPQQQTHFPQPGAQRPQVTPVGYSSGSSQGHPNLPQPAWSQNPQPGVQPAPGQGATPPPGQGQTPQPGKKPVWSQTPDPMSQKKPATQDDFILEPAGKPGQFKIKQISTGAYVKAGGQVLVTDQKTAQGMAGQLNARGSQRGTPPNGGNQTPANKPDPANLPNGKAEYIPNPNWPNKKTLAVTFDGKPGQLSLDNPQRDAKGNLTYLLSDPLGGPIVRLRLDDTDLVPTKRLPVGTHVLLPSYGTPDVADGTGQITKIVGDKIGVVVGSARYFEVPWWIALPDPRYPAVTEDPAATSAFTP